MFMSYPRIERGELESLLKKGADLIRTGVDYEYLLVLLFLKRISDVWMEEFEKMYKKFVKEYGMSEREAMEEAKKPDYHRFDIPEDCLWNNIRKDPEKLSERLAEALRKIAQRNPELQEVLDRYDFIVFTQSRENKEILKQLVELFSKYNLGDNYVSVDVVGDGYEWVIKYFAPQKAKEGEVFTPREVVRLMVELADPKPGESVYDPACGPAGMLIISYKYVKERYGEQEAKKLFLYGQERNNKIWGLAKMNILIHGIDAKIELGDSLLNPKFIEGGKLKKFDIVIANPPWNQDGYGEETLMKAEFKDRYKYGYPPNNSADWAWIQHMLASAKEDTGRVVVVLDQGALFRGGKEGEIRRHIVNDDLLEAVILLPEKLFYNTTASGIIMVFKKNKPKDRKGKILFINAINEYEKHPNIKRLNILESKNIEKIVKIYREFKDVKGFAKVVSLDEIRKNDYNLNVSLYVFPSVEEEAIDIEKVYEELKKLRNEREELWKKVESYIQEVLKL